MNTKLKIGVITTSFFPKLSKKQIKMATQKLNKYFDVRLYFSESEADLFGSVSVEEKTSLINLAASENEILLSLIGGFNQIELLLSFAKLRFNKGNIFVGQSDNTLLVNTLPSLGVCKSLYGKGFYNIATDYGNAEEMVEELYESIVRLKSANSNSGAVLIGGNNYTFDLLQGTKFAPKFNQPFILFMEGEDILRNPSETWVDFIRNIDSVMLQDGAIANIRGLILGKFPDSIKISKEEFTKFKDERPYLKGIPVIRDFECGHNKKSFKYLPIGQRTSIKMLNLI
jgi:muramoyltetrapeptide carboxypeptidase LdcA involved in peptidoglycan recycling